MTKFMTIAVFGLFAISTANAGEWLRLKAVGSIPLKDQSAQHLPIHGLDQAARHYVIQFASAITEQDQATLKDQDIEIQRYIPEDAMLVLATGDAINTAKLSSPRIRSIAPYMPEWKISPDLLSPSTARSESLFISTLGNAMHAASRELTRIPGVRIERAMDRDVVVSVSGANIAWTVQQISAIDSVEWIERAPVIVSFVMPMEDTTPAEAPPALTGFESGTKLMGFEAAWNRGYNGDGQIAAVADTGLDSGNASTLAKDFKQSFVKGYLSGMGTESWEDSMGHGTHVAGSVLGSGDASKGAFRGGAHGAKLLVEGLWSAILNNLAPASNFASLLDPIYKDGARVHTNSWGSAANFGSYDVLAARVDEYMWKNPELLVLFAAGNSGLDKDKDGHIDEGSVSSPGTAKNVLTVGASKNYLLSGGMQKPMKQLRDGDKKWAAEPIASSSLSENAQGLAAFSSRGPTNDGRLKPEIVAPGTNIVSTRSHVPGSSPLWGAYDDDYAYSGGTSMSTPLTAGAAVVTREFLVKSRGLSKPSAAIVKALLMHTATDLFPGQFGTGAGQELPTHRPNVHEGYGRVDMDALTAIGKETQLFDETTGVALNDEKTISVSVGNSGVLRATLSYTDAPAAVSSARALVNDLDLKITSPNGKVYENKDHTNNSEMIELSGLAAGAYQVSVRGNNIPQGKNGAQPYALVVTAQ